MPNAESAAGPPCSAACATAARLPSSQYVIRQLVVGVGEVLEQRDERAEQRAEDDAGEDQRQDRIVAPHVRAHRVHRPHRGEAAGERAELDYERAL